MLSTCSLTSGRVSKERDGREPRNAGADDQDLGRRDLARCRDLAREETAEMLCRLYDRPVAGNIRHGAQRIDLLRARDARDAIHRHDRSAGRGQLFEQLGILPGHDEADQRVLGPEHGELVVIGGPHLQDKVALRPELLRRRDDFAAGGFEGGI